MITRLSYKFDYYPFGMVMPGRFKQAESGEEYRFGFNGMEKDGEDWTGNDGSHLDFGARIYNSRLGKFLSIDPLTRDYPWQTPYAYHRNSPIALIDWNGYGDPPYVKNNVNFIHFCSPSISVVNRSDGGTFTDAALSVNTNEKIEYTVNMQQFEMLTKSATASYYIGAKVNMDEMQTQGLTIVDGQTQEGGRSSNSYYISQNESGLWSSGLGDPPSDSKIAFGGGIPLLVDGMPFGGEKKYDSEGNMIQNSSAGYPFQNNKTVGKTILAFDAQGNFMIVSQQNGVEGMTLDQIKEELISKGYTNAISFDGSTSSTLVKDNKVVVSPDKRKNNSIPVGATVAE
ncbi:MAG: phosphodiester glycosidase family protein [Bacteroidetes bacterium]|nr:phosphodiester glycosidase family protein [Bacteroidota bacterium]